MRLSTDSARLNTDIKILTTIRRRTQKNRFFLRSGYRHNILQSKKTMCMVQILLDECKVYKMIISICIDVKIYFVITILKLAGLRSACYFV